MFDGGDQIWNVELEQQILGAVLVNNDLFHMVSGIISWEDFFEPVHSEIWHRAATRIAKEHIASPVTMKTDFETHEGLKQLGGAEYLARMAGAAISSFAIKDYARELRSLSQRRSLRQKLSEASEALDTSEGVAECEMILASALAGISTDDGKSSSVSMMKAVTDTIKDMGRAYEGASGGLETGIGALDAKTGGMWPADLIILGGRPSMGKSAVAIEIAVNVAKQGVPVGFWSMEMTEQSIAQRALSAASGVKYADARRGTIDQESYQKVAGVARDVADLPLGIIPPHVRDIASGYAALKAERARMNGLGLVVVDYLQLIRAAGKSRFEQMTEVSLGLKHMAKMLNVPVLALAQLSRAIEQREDKRPMLSDLRESGQIEQDADAVLFCYRDSYYLSREKPPSKVEERADYEAALKASENVMELIIAKQRMGDIGTVKTGCDIATNKFWDLETQSDLEF